MTDNAWTYIPNTSLKRLLAARAIDHLPTRPYTVTDIGLGLCEVGLPKAGVDLRTYRHDSHLVDLAIETRAASWKCSASANCAALMPAQCSPAMRCCWAARRPAGAPDAITPT